MAPETDPSPIDLLVTLRDGIQIAAILLFWGVLASAGQVASAALELPWTVLGHDPLVVVAVLAGLANASIYVIARGIQFSRR